MPPVDRDPVDDEPDDLEGPPVEELDDDEPDNEDDDPELLADDDDPEPDEEDVENPPVRRQRQQRQAPRGQRHFGQLRKENRELRDQVNRLAGVTETLQRGTQPDTEAQRRAEEARLAEMEPEEREQYHRNKDRQDFGQAIAMTQLQANDRADRTEFRLLCMSNKLYAGVADEVEAEVQSLLRRGQRVDREVIAKVKIGERAVKKAEREEQRKASGQQRDQRRAGRSRATGGGSDVQPQREQQRRGGGKTAADRLKNVTF